MSASPTVLVTGATGATGSATVRELLQRGVKVRAMAHKSDQRSEKLAASGAEIAFGDLLDFRSVRAALEGVQRAYFVFPLVPEILQATGYFAQASQEVGLEAIVNMSQISARRETESNAARDHWLAERLLDRSGIAVTHLRPTLFAEWLIYAAPRVAQENCLSLPFGQGRHAAIAAEDLARVIAAILINPNPYRGQTYPLYGAVDLTFAEMTELMSEVLEREIRYRRVDFDSFEKALLARGGSAFLAQHLREISIEHGNGLFAGTNDTVERITGRRPMTVREFVNKNRSLFAVPAQASFHS